MYQLVLILNATVAYCPLSASTPVSYTQALLPSHPRVAVVENCMNLLSERAIPLDRYASYGECMKRVAAIGETQRERAICREVRP